ncbi:MAG: histidine triad nucleotide-binding protein [Patescibacteria group bacterium]
MSDCIFCEIAAGRSPAAVEYEDEKAIAFADINPAAPVHILVVPKKHIASIADLNAEDEPIVGHLVSVAKKLAENRQLEGYKLIFNVGQKGGQIVFHLHLHLLGGWDQKPAGFAI